MEKDLFVKTLEEEWDKPIVVAERIEEYYRELKDKYIYEHCYVLLIEEEDKYVLIKNLWKYDETDMRKCRNFNGMYFDVGDIEYIRIKGNEYLNSFDKEEIPKHIIINAEISC